MCAPCLSTEVDITEGITKEGILVQCRGCLRFQRSTGAKGSSGVFAECPLESLELMALCLKKINGLNKSVKLVDASFIWTEPHSKRIKLKLTIQKEAVRNAILQKAFVVTFIVENLKCPDCTKQFRNATWSALVQIRQKVNHKRTFYHLEQVILKHSAHERAIGMGSEKDGMDFFFSEKNSAERFAQFVAQHVPLRTKMARKLVSSDNHNNTANVKLTIVGEIAPICKDDLVVLDKRMAQLCGSSLVLVSRVTTQIHILDPLTARRAEIPSDRYWKNPFEALDSAASLVDFIVLDVELLERKAPLQQTNEIDQMAIVEVARVSDFGVNDTTFHVTTHLGRYLSAGDNVKGYDLGRCNFGTQQLYYLKDDLPDIILVRRVFPKKDPESKKGGKKKKAPRKSLGMGRGGGKDKDMEREEAEYEAFMEEYEAEEEGEELDEGKVDTAAVEEGADVETQEIVEG
ncbi:Aste57867_24458 [Aphanomyces stellatus]|uniref:60S ribosomal export protein NMD3 n=1 Tax=Aphanomyces stellatus TaxID=120398 RepID=A0A485LQE1_9STRA|nr:hypothetical protein As57867_024382 [Aphanomyces stellatus]VFU01098.1 Aste57867_24458 [Aphanomyces stellatus]